MEAIERDRARHTGLRL